MGRRVPTDTVPNRLTVALPATHHRVCDPSTTCPDCTQTSRAGTAPNRRAASTSRRSSGRTASSADAATTPNATASPPATFYLTGCTRKELSEEAAALGLNERTLRRWLRKLDGHSDRDVYRFNLAFMDSRRQRPPHKQSTPSTHPPVGKKDAENSGFQRICGPVQA
jgi:hypothetical protein